MVNKNQALHTLAVRTSSLSGKGVTAAIVSLYCSARLAARIAT